MKLDPPDGADSNPFSKSVYELNKNFYDKKYATDPEAYMNEAISAILMTKTGKKTHECYKKATGEFLNSGPNDKIEFKFETDRDGANFRVEEDPQNTSKMKKVIYINPNDNPSKLLPLLVHEMQHGCLANTHAKN